jgi:hypothetical protein
MPARNGTLLYGPDGRPIEGTAEYRDGFDLPHVLSFASVLGGAYKTYWHDKWDEALKHGREGALAMRRDAWLMALLRERRLATTGLRWHVEVDDERDPYQKALKDGLGLIARRTPHLHRMLYYLLDAIWYGRYAAHVRWQWEYLDLPDVWSAPTIPGVAPGVVNQTNRPRRALVVKDHRPVNGDKLNYRYDGTPAVAVHAAHAEAELPNATLITGTYGARLLVLEGTWRERFLIHQHEVEDADFWEAEAGQRVHGVGVRDTLYWWDWLKREFLEWMTSFYERSGLGVRVWPFDASNPNAKAEAEAAAREQTRSVNIVVPVWPGKDGRGVGGFEVLDAPVAGAEALLGLIQYIDAIEERFVVGQSMSGGADAESGLGGTGRAMFAADTKQAVVAFDAHNLAQTLSTDMLGVIQRWTYPEGEALCARWTFNVDELNPAAKLQAVVQAAQVGVDFKKDEVRGLTGMSDPLPGDDVIGGAQGLGPQAPPGSAGGPGGAPPGGGSLPPPGGGLSPEEQAGLEDAFAYGRAGEPFRYAVTQPTPQPPPQPAARPVRVSRLNDPPLHAAPVPVPPLRQPGQAAGVPSRALAQIHAHIDEHHPPHRIPEQPLGQRPGTAPPAEQVFDPASGEWRERPYSGHTPENYLTGEQYRQRFGHLAGPREAMREALRQQGLTAGGLAGPEGEYTRGLAGRLPPPGPAHAEVTDPETGERVRKPFVSPPTTEPSDQAEALKRHLDEVPGLAQWLAGHAGPGGLLSRLDPVSRGGVFDNLRELVGHAADYPHLLAQLPSLSPHQLASFLDVHKHQAGSAKQVPVKDVAGFLKMVGRVGVDPPNKVIRQMDLPRPVPKDRMPTPPRPGEMVEFTGPDGKMALPATVMKVEDQGSGWHLTVDLDHGMEEYRKRFEGAYQTGYRSAAEGDPSHGNPQRELASTEETIRAIEARHKREVAAGYPTSSHKVARLKQLRGKAAELRQVVHGPPPWQRFYRAGRGDAEAMYPYGHSAEPFALPPGEKREHWLGAHADRAGDMLADELERHGVPAGHMSGAAIDDLMAEFADAWHDELAGNPQANVRDSMKRFARLYAERQPPEPYARPAEPSRYATGPPGTPTPAPAASGGLRVPHPSAHVTAPAAAPAAVPGGTPAAPAKAPGVLKLGEHGPSRAPVEIHRAHAHNEGRIRHAIKALLGVHAGPEHIPSLVGAPDDSKVRLLHGHAGSDHGAELGVSVYHPHFGRRSGGKVVGETMDRGIGIDPAARLFMENIGLFIKPEHQGGGMGRDIFVKQVQHLMAHGGFDHIKTHAARLNPSEPSAPHAGYYAWPNMGYDQPVHMLSADLRAAVARDFPGARSVLDIIEAPAVGGGDVSRPAGMTGREWWKAHGEDLHDAQFDLKPGSRSLQRLNDYLTGKASRGGA